MATADQRLMRPAGLRVPVESAISGLVTEEEELDYEEEVPVSGVQSVVAQKATTSGRAVQGDCLSCCRDLAGNLRRGYVGGPYGGCSVWIGGHSFVRWAEKQAV
ncbi:hypothetical protein NDU88_001575 [Pleurodeles waltl]|uniref:Uncharacterized protein n=1 Tax=Pleurodeles waltl TaxID=8319 RepID=A0AAV7WMQ2_PLEWA|nr:hypothetical protein NDU88_001575 [Pleurodeles waltl]